MRDITVYHLKTCDTCRKALKALTAANYNITAVDVRADGVPTAKLKAIAKAVGWEDLLNTRSTTWRGLSDNEKSDMTASKALTLMAQHPTLIKRPVIVEDVTTVGWTKVQQEVWL